MGEIEGEREREREREREKEIFLQNVRGLCVLQLLVPKARHGSAASSGEDRFALEIITKIGCSLSLAGLLITFITVTLNR